MSYFLSSGKKRPAPPVCDEAEGATGEGDEGDRAWEEKALRPMYPGAT